MSEWDEERLTYKDFEIGQVVTLVKELPYDDTIAIGTKCKITDLDFHFPYQICVKFSRRVRGFFSIEYFDDGSYLRERKIDGLLDEKEV